MYIIRGTYKNGNVYFVDSYYKNNSKVNIFSLTIDGAKRIQGKKTAIQICIDMKDDSFKVFNICPICHEEYSEPPAISRRDNKTYICSNCGYKEAIFDFINKRV